MSLSSRSIGVSPKPRPVMNPFVIHKNSVPYVVYSFLNGATLYHKIALLNKATRLALP